MQAVRDLGGRDFRIVVRHVLPGVVAPVVIAATLGIAGAIMAESSLSFLGLGVQPPTPSWGAMIDDGTRYLTVAPWLVVPPGVAVVLAVLGFYLVGQGLQDEFDPFRQVRV